MQNTNSNLASRLTVLSVQHPWVTVCVSLVIVAFLGVQASKVTKEVGYSAFFSPNDEKVIRMTEHLEEFQTGLHVLVVFGCDETDRCERADDQWALDFLGRLQSKIDSLPNIRKTWSILNTPIIVGPLETQLVGRRVGRDGWQLEENWSSLIDLAREQPLVSNAVLARDGHAAAIVVELQSMETDPMRGTVHALLDLRHTFEEELGSTIYMAGDPIWSVISADNLDKDAVRLTVAMFLIMLVVLWVIFRDIWLTVLPVISVGVLFLSVQGIAGILSISTTVVMNALPPILVAIAVTASIHYLAAYLRSIPDKGATEALVSAARQVGSGCFWAAVTTAAGFASFMLSDLTSFRHFGLLGAIGLGLAFVITFTLLTALLCLRAGVGHWVPKRHRLVLPAELLEATLSSVRNYSRFILAVTMISFLFLASGATYLFYAGDQGFGEQSFVIRSIRFIEANFRKSLATEVVISVPRGNRIYDGLTLRLLDRVERIFAKDPTTGSVWSFLDLLQEAYRVDHGHQAANLEDLIRSAPREMAIVALFDQTPSFWSETTFEGEDGETETVDRARVSADREWVDEAAQTANVAQLREDIAALEDEYAGLGFRFELQGGCILGNLFLVSLKDTQRKSFTVAFLVVSVTLVLLLWGSGSLMLWSIVANVFPVLSLIGLMGWLGVGIDPATAMVAAVLLVIAVDDTIHMTLRYRRERLAGASVSGALEKTFRSVGEALVVSSFCLALGFLVMIFSEMGGVASFGLLASLGVVLALIGDIVLLPAALLSFGRERASGV